MLQCPVPRGKGSRAWVPLGAGANVSRGARPSPGEEFANRCLDSILNRSSNELRNDFPAARPRSKHKLRKREDWTVRRFFLSLLIDHMMNKYLIVIQRYHLHRQLSKEIVKIGQSIQKL
jgi:hypothetical protein